MRLPEDILPKWKRGELPMNDIFRICGIENDKIIDSIKQKAASADNENVSVMSESVQHDINIDRRWDIVRDIGVTSHRKKIGKLIVALKNKTVKFYKWYTDRLFDQQVEFNHVIWESYNAMRNELDQLKREVDELKSKEK